MRKFTTGSTRDTDKGKYDFEGFLSPLFIQEFGRYMHKHRKQADGTLRASDNWQKGFGKDVPMKSLWRHFHQLWSIHRGYFVFEERHEGEVLTHVLKYLPITPKPTWRRVTVEDSIMGCVFNLQAYYNELGDYPLTTGN